MSMLESALKAMEDRLEEARFSLKTAVLSRALGIKEALGDPSPYKDFALQRGVEKLMDVEIDGHHGQSFTSQPCNWKGTVEEVLAMKLNSDKDRALAAGTINALASVLGIASGTVHCKDDGPDRCGAMAAPELENRLPKNGVLGIVGYQPALLHHAAKVLGPGRVRVADLNPANIGELRCGVRIWDGDKDMDTMADEASLCFATGSSIINGSADSILNLFHKRNKEVIFFGTTIAGTAALLGLERICPCSL